MGRRQVRWSGWKIIYDEDYISFDLIFFEVGLREKSKSFGNEVAPDEVAGTTDNEGIDISEFGG